MFATDEELGKLRKKDDDIAYKPRRASWYPFRNGSVVLPPKYRKRRYVLPAIISFILFFLYFFQPSDLHEPGHARPRPGQRGYGTAPQLRQPPAAAPAAPEYGARGPARGGDKSKAPTGPPPRSRTGAVKTSEPEHYYNGEIVFRDLPTSLRGITKTMGYARQNRNVLFAVSNLKSAATLIPLACEMGSQGRTFVHVTFMGRNDLAITEILKVNGVDTRKCDVYWHDGRPDYTAYSTDVRAEAAVRGALTHIQAYMHPQVIVMDDSLLEDTFFTRGLRYKAGEFQIPIIEIPAGQADRLSWISRLDASALASWHKSSVDVLIHAEAQSTGSLMRLLTSLYMADYAGLSPPRVTIELPQNFDAITKQYISGFPWPPRRGPSSGPQQNQLSLRHRITRKHSTPEEASIRFMESFYPADGQNNHILVLSPNAQLSPLFFQYLKYNILQYRYADAASMTSTNLLGISLDLPETFLNDTTPFTPPHAYTVAGAAHQPSSNATDTPMIAPFLWQAPNTNAALYFGDKWMELHSFLQKRLDSFNKPSGAATARPKYVSAKLPAWTEYFLELMRARGYAMLYPASVERLTSEGSTAASSAEHRLVTMHNEQYSPPDEFLASSSDPTGTTTPSAAPPAPKIFDEPFLMPTENLPPAGDATTSLQGPAILLPTYSTHLESILPVYRPPTRSLPTQQKADLFSEDDDEPVGVPPTLAVMPYLSFDGYMLDNSHVQQFAVEYAQAFRLELGGCKDVDEADKAALRAPERGSGMVKGGLVGDLFCI